jgi:hypothetical protein
LTVAVVFKAPVEGYSFVAIVIDSENGKQRPDNWLIVHKFRVFAQPGSLASPFLALIAPL